MRRLLFPLLALLAAHALPARADDQPKAPEPMTVERSTKAGTAAGGSVEQVTGTIQAVDVEKREVTVKGPKGQVETIHVGPDVKNLAQVKAGDKVVVRFYRGLALTYQPPDQAPAAPSVSGAVEAAPMGAKPAGEAVVTLRGTVVVKAIDLKSRVVSLAGPEGQVYRVKAGADVKIDKLKVGDKIYAVYQEGLAISVEPVKAKKKK